MRIDLDIYEYQKVIPCRPGSVLFYFANIFLWSDVHNEVKHFHNILSKSYACPKVVWPMTKDTSVERISYIVTV